MTCRLGEYVVYGELHNRRNYTTDGVIVLRGEMAEADTVIRLDLTGDCGADLKGKSVRFRPEEGEGEEAIYYREEYRGFQDRQIGPTGTMTTQGWVRTLPCPVAEFMRRKKLGEPPPTPWKRRLYLEWFGQNGRVVVEMAGAVVEECVRLPEGEADEGDWAPLLNLALPPESLTKGPGPGPGITIVRRNDDGASIDVWRPRPRSEETGEEAYESIPDALQQAFDREAAAVDLAIRGGDDADGGAFEAELELMDYCIEHEEGCPAGQLLEDLDRYPRPETLSDEEVEAQLKVLLGELALLNVALGVCEHFSPRDCCRLLLDTILAEEEVYEPLIGTGWVQHFTTHEFCPECEAEIDEMGLGTDGAE